jgi:hypothetical protein
MSLLRTIQAQEDPAWVELFFTEGPHDGDLVPLWPYQLPFPFILQEDVVSGFAYVIYRRHIVGYARIQQVITQETTYVGTERQPVRSGQSVVMDGPYVRMPAELRDIEVRGFTGIRYTPKNLHKVGPTALCAELKTARVKVY